MLFFQERHKSFMEIIGYDKVFVGYDTLDGSNDEFILQLGFSF